MALLRFARSRLRTAVLGAICLLSLGLSSAKAEEYLILSGGPALRLWENYRAEEMRHDRWWGNFIRSARVRVQDLRKAQPSLPITWLVYRPGFDRRTAEDKRPLISFIESVRDTYNVRLVWITSGDDVIRYINNRSRSNPVIGFEYFGHSNKHCFMLDYSSEIYGVSTAWLHERDLKKLRKSAFASNAYCHSWGCHTGESMSAAWKKATGLWMVGAAGKTDYSDGHITGWRVRLSPGAHWRTRG